MPSPDYEGIRKLMRESATFEEYCEKLEAATTYKCQRCGRAFPVGKGGSVWINLAAGPVHSDCLTEADIEELRPLLGRW